MNKEKNYNKTWVYSLLIMLLIIFLIIVIFYLIYLSIKVNNNNKLEETNENINEVIENNEPQDNIVENDNNETFSLEDIPDYNGSYYIEVNHNIPYFKTSEYTTESFESYSELDSLGRCGVAYANVGIDIMPTEPRKQLTIVPTGYIQKEYENVSGKYLYNRCHLIGYQLTGENNNKNNLITCTRNMNMYGMLPFENSVAEYIRETKNHVLYRVTPIFEGENLVASGTLIEAYSIEDSGEGIEFNVFVYNNQPGININYLDGTSSLSE